MFVGIEEHPDYPLVLASNRDEEYDRPASPCGWWDANGPYAGILAGRDLRKGGTWLGVQPRRGLWSVLTNVREPAEDQRVHSRGQLPLMMLANDDEAKKSPHLAAATSDEVRRKVARILASAPSYDGFNLLVGGGGEVWWLSNRAEHAGLVTRSSRSAGTSRGTLGDKCFAERLGKGVHVLSNALLDTPWHKVRRGRSLFSAVLDADAARGAPPTAVARRRLALELLTTVLSDNERASVAELPRNTGYPQEIEDVLSSICVAQLASEKQGPGYGTVAQTVLLIDRDGHAMLAERLVQNGKPLGAPSLFEFPFPRPGRRFFDVGSTIRGRAFWTLGLVSAAACLGCVALQSHKQRSH